ncbi:helix-turn-helix transcriptional regulator [Lacihabitans soyangensis]|uniref:WYL domain-containing protein n=1 Tax=Lacihabitans soyangensis TaxID=869394 RepID=A0AAE3KS83_9BACT|nr:WYL domain-containing protein [Lacihabitans soyangensis]MCP9763057.1 WYL domain-containing protein [Lacihabitans soyangensis]
MPLNRNALIRYKVIDSCLQRRNRKWTLEDIIEAVSDTLFEYEGIDKGISKRTIQADIQMMRSDKLGYFAPIIVTDKKYYSYEDPNYSITNIPLSESDLSKMNEAVEMLKQFKGFSHFSQLNEVVQKLEDHVYSTSKKSLPIIDFEKNDNLKGLEFLEVLYQSAIQKKVVEITYKSFKAENAQTFEFHIWWMKEFRNRWFAVGVKNSRKIVQNLAIDRMIAVRMIPEKEFIVNENINPENFYKNVFGVTVSQNLRPIVIKLFVNQNHAPYVLTKPLHHSQVLEEDREDGIIICLKVQHNFEIEREILGFGEGMVIIEPPKLRGIIKKRLEKMLLNYQV